MLYLICIFFVFSFEAIQDLKFGVQKAAQTMSCSSIIDLLITNFKLSGLYFFIFYWHLAFECYNSNCLDYNILKQNLMISFRFTARKDYFMSSLSFHYLSMAVHSMIQKNFMEQVKSSGLTSGQPKVLDYLRDHNGANLSLIHIWRCRRRG